MNFCTILYSTGLNIPELKFCKHKGDAQPESFSDAAPPCLLQSEKEIGNKLKEKSAKILHSSLKIKQILVRKFSIAKLLLSMPKF